MSTNKKDPVIEFLSTYVEANDASNAGKLMLYANTNGAGMLNEKAERLPALRQRIQLMQNTSDADFDMVGLELPLTSLSITSRVRHTITELLGRIEIANLIRAHIYVAAAKGTQWPPVTIAPVGDTAKVVNPLSKLNVIKSIKAEAKHELVNDLPNIIDHCYLAKYKSPDSFSYSLSETKCYSIQPAFLTVALTWLKNRLELDSVHESQNMFSHVANGKGLRRPFLFEEWCAYSYNKSRDTHSYPPSYKKLAKVLTARVGKAIFGSPSDEGYSLKRTENAKVVLGYVLGTGVNTDLEKKKDVQIKFYHELLSKVKVLYERHASVSDKAQREQLIFTDIMGLVTGTYREWVDALDIEHALVSLDVIEPTLPYYSKGQFMEVAKTLIAHPGACNDRVLNAVYKCISTSSLIVSASSRKVIPHEIETVIVESCDLSKIKTTTAGEPSIIFTQDALNKMSHSDRSRFAHLVDQNTRSSTGYVQKGTMGVTSSLKIAQLKDVNPFEGQPHHEATFKLAANRFDEIANLFDLCIADLKAERKKILTAAENKKKLVAKYGGFGSPAAQQGTTAFIGNTFSPAQGQSQTFFSSPAPVENNSIIQSNSMYQSEVSAPVELFGSAPFASPLKAAPLSPKAASSVVSPFKVRSAASTPVAVEAQTQSFGENLFGTPVKANLFGSVEPRASSKPTTPRAVAAASPIQFGDSTGSGLFM